MILSDIRRYLEQRGQASVFDIAMHCDTQPDAVRGMLQVWVRKGLAYKLPTSPGCGSGCTKCDSAATEVYAWRTAPAPAAAVECVLRDCRKGC
ncbi:MAG: FeoC-like transcriptional regulator [Thiogranum sp.]